MTGKPFIHERRAAAVQTNDDPQKGSSGTFAIFAPFCANSLSSFRDAAMKNPTLGEDDQNQVLPAATRMHILPFGNSIGQLSDTERTLYVHGSINSQGTFCDRF
jgi:hypothetical protein